MKDVILAGGAKTADVVCAFLQNDQRYKLAALTVDDKYINECKKGLFPIVGVSYVSKSFPPSEFSVIMAMGYSNLNRSRETMFNKLKHLGYTIESYIHPDASINTDHPVGEGCLILPNAVIEPEAQIGVNSIIWSNAVIAHHGEVSKNCWVAAGTVVSGASKVNKNSVIGINASIVNGITVAEYNFIGAGSLISKNTKPNTVWLARSAEPFRGSAEDYVEYYGF